MNISLNQKIAQIILYPFLHYIIKVRVKGVDNIPPKPFIIASNHIGMIDPFLLTALSLKDINKVTGIRFIVASKFYDNWLLRSIIKPLGSLRAEPIVWSYDQFFSESKAALSDGNPVLIYLEGGRNRDSSRNIKPGVGYLATATGYPVVPLKITRPSYFRYSISFGTAITVEDPNHQKTSENIYKKIIAL